MKERKKKRKKKKNYEMKKKIIWNDRNETSKEAKTVRISNTQKGLSRQSEIATKEKKNK